MDGHVWTKFLYTLLLIPGVALAERGETRGASAGDSHQPALPPSSTPMATGRIVFNSNRGGNHEICVMNADGSDVKTLTHDGRYDSWWPRVSPDRRHVLFYRNVKSKRKEDYSQTALWIMASDGSGVTELRPVGLDGWAMQGHAEWSPDGKQLVMFGGPHRPNPQIYVTTNTGQEPRQITNRAGQNLDPSWSPAGKQIVFVGCPAAICFSGDYEIYTVAVSGDQPAVRRTFDNLRDQDPYFSPDGKYVAWLTQTAGMLASPPAGSWSIRVAQADQQDWGQEGSFRWIINDKNINSYPAWSPDGTRIAFHRLVLGKGKGFGIFTIKLDGSDLRELPKGLQEICEYPAFSSRSDARP